MTRQHAQITQAARRLLLLGLLLGLLSACGPEDGRARGGGPGADVGNHPADVRPRSKVFSSQEGQP